VAILFAQGGHDCKRNVPARRESPVPQGAEDLGPLSVHYAFVVHFRTNSAVTQGRVAGRVEHVVSGQTTAFQTLEGLLAFMARMLAERGAGPPEAC